MVMLLTTLFTPLMSVASLVINVFSGAFLAVPMTVTTPFLDSILIASSLKWILYEHDLRKDDSMRSSVLEAHGSVLVTNMAPAAISTSVWISLVYMLCPFV